MKRIIFISVLAALAVLGLQCIWLYKVHQSYVQETMQTIDEVLFSSIGVELDLRSFGLQKIEVRQDTQSQSTSEEPRQIKEYKLDQALLNNKKNGQNIYEIVQQLEQDALINNNIPIQLSKLDSIFQEELSLHEIRGNYCILLYNKDTVLVQNIGSLSPEATSDVTTKLFPIGTKGLQYVRVKADILLSNFLKQMLWLLLVSAAMIAIVIGCVIYQMIVIRKKNMLFKQRETTVNGTVHDLKSPLNSIITMLNWIQKKIEDKTIRQLIENSLSQTSHLIGDIDALLVTARKDRQKLMLQKQNVDLHTLVDNTQKRISIQYSFKKHTIRVTSSPENITIHVDPMYTENVIRNLIENSLKYSDEGVEIMINGKIEGKYTVVTVSDNGWGIDKKYHKKIFSQFYQVPRPKSQTQQGYGVGLSYVKFIVESHGGYITVDSDPGKGSAFTCYFPII